MRNIRKFATCAVLVAFTSISYGKEWRGIVPLQSTREDVTRLLGIPRVTNKHRDLYNLKDEIVLIDYSTGVCKQGGIWNVPPDTVLAISVSPRKALEISDLSLNLSRYQILTDKHLSGIFYYNNAEEGIHITTDREIVRSIDYLPSAKDEYLRCAKPPPHLTSKDGEAIEPHSLFDAYGILPFGKEKQHLDVFGRRLQNFGGAKGYIVVYHGDEKNTRQALFRANRAKKYLRRNYRVRDSSIEIVRGGRRNEFTLELYIVPPASQKPD